VFDVLQDNTFLYLNAIGITSISQLKTKDPKQLYKKLKSMEGSKIYICMLDRLAAIVHEAKTGEKLPWWNFTKIRKRLI